MSFFRKGTKSLETIDPHVKLVAEQKHIDYQFSGLEDDGVDDEVDDDCSSDPNDDGELSFDYGPNDQNMLFSSARNSMEVGVLLLDVCLMNNIWQFLQLHFQSALFTLQTTKY